MDTSDEGTCVYAAVANPDGVRFRCDARIADIYVVVSSRRVKSCVRPNRGVAAADGVAGERIDPEGGVVGAGGVVLEGSASSGGVGCQGRRIV